MHNFLNKNFLNNQNYIKDDKITIYALELLSKDFTSALLDYFNKNQLWNYFINTILKIYIYFFNNSNNTLSYKTNQLTYKFNTRAIGIIVNILLLLFFLPALLTMFLWINFYKYEQQIYILLSTILIITIILLSIIYLTIPSYLYNKISKLFQIFLDNKNIYITDKNLNIVAKIPFKSIIKYFDLTYIKHSTKFTTLEKIDTETKHITSKLISHTNLAAITLTPLIYIVLSFKLNKIINPLALISFYISTFIVLLPVIYIFLFFKNLIKLVRKEKTKFIKHLNRAELILLLLSLLMIAPIITWFIVYLYY